MAQFVRRCAEGIDAAARVAAVAAAALHTPRLVLDEDHFRLCSGVSKGKLKESHRGGSRTRPAILDEESKGLRSCSPAKALASLRCDKATSPAFSFVPTPPAHVMPCSTSLIAT
jgi:hypothetical protein